ncbi:MAG: hypothetical protein KDE51_25470, partial [Anaerolineales bacterium]|nr:hypothetical protein [Anaerolineales bacterium]
DPYGRLLITLAEQERLPELYSYLENSYPQVQWREQVNGIFMNAQRDIELEIHGDFVGGDKITNTVTAGSGAAVAGDNSTAIGERGVNIEDSDLTNAAIITGDYAHVIIGVQIDDIEDMPAEAGESPYQGLNYFTEDDADWFFGRDKATGTLVNRLHDLDFLAVVGASGSGKSSLVRAGVVPVMKGNKKLTNGMEPPVGTWHVETFTPTARPVAKLAAVQKEAKRELTAKRENEPDEEHRLLLFVDQFEELFTLCEKEEERISFIEQLLVLANDNLGTKVIITVRADFYEECIRYRQLQALLTTNQALLGQMATEELTAAILQPAAKGKWQFQEGLAEEILEEIGDEPGRLPLLSHALYETWTRRKGRILTLSGYREAGKVQGAIAKTAESTFEELPKEQQAIAQQVFLRLTELGAGTQDTRRRVNQTEFDSDETIQRVIQQLADKRLVTTSQEGVDVAHEALIRQWPRLQTWLNADREGLMIHRRLTNATQDWLDNGQDDTLLYTGFRLSEANQWAEQNETALNRREMAFLDASQAKLRRSQRLRNLLFASAVIAVIFMTVLAIFSARTSAQLTDALETSDANLNAAQMAGTSEALALMNAQTQEALAVNRQSEAEANLATAEAASTAEVVAVATSDVNQTLINARQLVSQGQEVYESNPLLGLILVLEGLALVDEEQAEDLLNNVRGSIFNWGRIFDFGNQVEEIIASPKETFVIINYIDSVGEIRSSANGSLIETLPGDIASVQFNPAETLFIIDYENVAGEIRDSADGSLIAPLPDEVSNFRFSLNTNILHITYENETNGLAAEIRDSNTGSIITEFSDSAFFKFSHTDRYVVVDYDNENVSDELIDASSGQVIMTFDNVITSEYALAGTMFSPDDTSVFVRYLSKPDNELRSTVSGSLLASVPSGSSSTFSPNGQFLVINYSAEEILTEIRQSNDGEIVIELPSDTSVYNFSPDDRFFVTNTGELWSTDKREVVATLLDGPFRFEFNQSGDFLIIQYIESGILMSDDIPENGEIRQTIDGSIIEQFRFNAFQWEFDP